MANFSFTFSLPLIRCGNYVMRMPKKNEAQALLNYYRQNRNHLKAWEPARTENFYTLPYWHGRVRHILRDYKNDQALCLVLIDSVEEAGLRKEKIIGVINYSFFIRGALQSCFLGFSIDRDYQGHGIMHACLQKTNRFIFEQLGFHRIQACYLPHNERSANLLHKLGFEKEGMAKRYLKIDGHWQDHVLTSLIRDDYE